METYCEKCADKNTEPCCNYGYCEHAEVNGTISNCIHCGGEMHEVDGSWYHHSQFDNDGKLISPNNPQW